MAAFDASIGNTLNAFLDLSHLGMYPGMFRPPLGFDAQHIAPFGTKLPHPDNYYEAMSQIVAVRASDLPTGERYVALLGKPSEAGRSGAAMSFEMAVDDERVLGCFVSARPEIDIGMPRQEWTLARIPLAVLMAEQPLDQDMYKAERLAEAEALISAAGALLVAAAVNVYGASSPVAHDQLRGDGQ